MVNHWDDYFYSFGGGIGSSISIYRYNAIGIPLRVIREVLKHALMGANFRIIPALLRKASFTVRWDMIGCYLTTSRLYIHP